MILKKKDKMLVDDKAFVVINASQINATLLAFGHEEKLAKKILIVGEESYSWVRSLLVGSKV